ncbi:hypothetical protein [Paenarthrobacter nicotinovorans]|uniref:hypothetical protein n=1 Tax=Paenarthrobacter nicotinovorans TaxID=29320 RepID=UPI001663B480|nr:hypothetical protein [Paenarthrobacter nicotinovorans]MBP2395135.1 hypothetical protein [Paenarthrobacter nicotinovorans]UKE98716.1 hypothetical protein LU808_17315 [Paenarthrobacter nicotinovorans]UKF03505.1 hypothetical protein JMY29_17350 [Paenarthrobacter nicotinovorans]
MSPVSAKINSAKERTLRVSATKGDHVDLTIGASDPVAVRLEIDNNCGCADGHARGVGSYTDTDFGRR